MAEFQVEFVPFGESKPIILTEGLVKDLLAVKTRRGLGPSPGEVRTFLERCAAQALNPFTGDAFLIGYDGSDGDPPTFSLITSHQALLKRAEAKSVYEGMESGVIVMRKPKSRPMMDRKPTEEELAAWAAEANAVSIAEQAVLRAGDLFYDDEVLLGGWAVVYRQDKRLPSSDRLKLSVYNTGKSRWAKDPAGLIVKCAEASALRKAFPSTLGGMYLQSEMDSVAMRSTEFTDAEVADRFKSRVSGLLPHTEIAPLPLNGRTDDAVRECVPTKERPVHHEAESVKSVPVESGPVERREERVESQGPKSIEPDQKAEEPAWPAPVLDVFRIARQAKTASSLTLARHRWGIIAADHPDAAEAVLAFLARRESEVAPVGAKP